VKKQNVSKKLDTGLITKHGNQSAELSLDMELESHYEFIVVLPASATI
jgi:hypothetical protein